MCWNNFTQIKTCKNLQTMETWLPLEVFDGDWHLPYNNVEGYNKPRDWSKTCLPLEVLDVDWHLLYNNIEEYNELRHGLP